MDERSAPRLMNVFLPFFNGFAARASSVFRPGAATDNTSSDLSLNENQWYFVSMDLSRFTTAEYQLTVLLVLYRDRDCAYCW